MLTGNKNEIVFKKNKMKKCFLLIVTMFFSMSSLWAFPGDGGEHLTPEEFRATQKDFIIKDAGLTTQEADLFFPIFFELQDKKKKIIDESWKLLRLGRNNNVTESQYATIIVKVSDLRIACDRLDRTYLNKFKKILSCKKIYLVQTAEMKFSRRLLWKMHHKVSKDGHKCD